MDRTLFFWWHSCTWATQFFFWCSVEVVFECTQKDGEGEAVVIDCQWAMFNLLNPKHPTATPIPTPHPLPPLFSSPPFSSLSCSLTVTCLPLWLYHICSWKSWKSIGCSGNSDSLSKVPDSDIHEEERKNPNQRKKHTTFLIYPESSLSYFARTYRSHFWTHCTCGEKRKYADLLSEVLCACGKDTK